MVIFTHACILPRPYLGVYVCFSINIMMRTESGSGLSKQESEELQGQIDTLRRQLVDAKNDLGSERCDNMEVWSCRYSVCV